MGENGDFVSVAGHYNVNRNNFFGSVPLRLDPDLNVGSGRNVRFPITKDEREYLINYPCTVSTVAKIGRAHVGTPVTNAHLVCRLLLEKKKPNKYSHYQDTINKQY